MFDDLVYEFKMHRLLKSIARQRVAIILELGAVPVIERAIKRNEETKALFLTAQIRGWVEILHENIPTGSLDAEGRMNIEQPFQSRENHWKLTDSGWAAIQRRHQVSILGLFVALAGVFLAIGT
ncbi:hypothetical protein GCM10007978_19280 [Shewanella hanedai]|uniref:Uncharacterized protein n=1 Tax=Shewanella hanedai TaxID=25 RepID=A0A553JDV3_SHEHA|nr:hypothetical protein [Shewanella hanedai]TRY10642.1 hypothetical protein FN961_25130 [Shewanella hanedai]GGI81587.1 hypothetical protein GCM10007978_19280 [Shewanella hanedai]